MSENDIIDLQSRLMDLEKQVQELSDVVTDQWAIIDALKRSAVQQQDRIVELESRRDKKGEQSAIDEARENIPPHY